MPLMQTRRRFLTTLSLAAAAGVARAHQALAGEGAPEITSVRIQKSASICNASRYVAQELLRAEGFTDIRYVSVPKQSDAVYPAFMRGDFDFITDFAPLCVNAIDQGIAVTVLAGVHAGCFELFANEDVHSIADLRGKTIGVDSLNSPQHMFLAPIAAQPAFLMLLASGFAPVYPCHGCPVPGPAPGCRRRARCHCRGHRRRGHRRAASVPPPWRRPNRTGSRSPGSPRRGRRSRPGDRAADDRRTSTRQYEPIALPRRARGRSHGLAPAPQPPCRKPGKR
jgi:hypothetical protein